MKITVGPIFGVPVFHGVIVLECTLPTIRYLVGGWWVVMGGRVVDGWWVVFAEWVDGYQTAWGDCENIRSGSGGGLTG